MTTSVFSACVIFLHKCSPAAPFPSVLARPLTVTWDVVIHCMMGWPPEDLCAVTLDMLYQKKKARRHTMCWRWAVGGWRLAVPKPGT